MSSKKSLSLSSNHNTSSDDETIVEDILLSSELFDFAHMNPLLSDQSSPIDDFEMVKNDIDGI
jgi:hypothetical protein